MCCNCNHNHCYGNYSCCYGNDICCHGKAVVMAIIVGMIIIHIYHVNDSHCFGNNNGNYCCHGDNGCCYDNDTLLESS